MFRDFLPFCYLGCQLFGGQKKKLHFQHLIDKVHEKLAGWKGKLLSPGRRFILIKHVLSTISLFTLVDQDAPKAILL